jgi:3-oxoacyl-[acyl-carrier-protein] synthase II
MNKRRVVVTGLGIVSALGLDVPSTWSAILEGKSGISTINHFDTSALSSRFSGSISNFSLADFKTKHLNKMDLFIQYGLHAAREAISDSNLKESSVDKSRVGVSIGSGIGGLSLIERQHSHLLKAYQLNRSPSRLISPFFIPGTIINLVSGVCSIEYGFTGPNLAVATACTTGTHNIGLGARAITYGDADVMVVGGAEMGSTPLSIAGFSACRALSTYNECPEKASRPWDKDRDGFVLADGASVLVLEEYEHALSRDAFIYGELCGFGMSSDAYDITSPDPEGKGAQAAMENALKDASLTPKDIDYINAHATSTKLGDVAEIRAIEKTFGSHNTALRISATKSMTGHLLGASGAIEAAFCLLALRDQMVPPTINLNHPEEECSHLNLVPHQAQHANIQFALSNSFGFGGTNGSLIFGKCV